MDTSKKQPLMRRREFLGVIAGTVGTAAIGLPLIGEHYPKHWGRWEVDEDGILSLDHQSIFQSYGESGELDSHSLRYRLLDANTGLIEIEEIANAAAGLANESPTG